MSNLQLTGQKRTKLAKGLTSLRGQGLVPGVVYGQSKQATAIQAELQQLERVYQQAGGNQLVELKVEGNDPANVLFHEVQLDPMTRRIRHFDLYTVRMDEKIKTEVPIHFLSEAPAVHKLSAILVKNIEAIEVEALPTKLPENMEVDLSGMEEIGQAIHVSDLQVPTDVTVLTDPETLIVKTDPPRSEEEIAELEEAVEEGAEAEVVAEHGAEAEAGETAEAEEGKSAEPEPEGEEPARKTEDQSD